MSGTTRRILTAGAVALCLGLVALSSVAIAAPINYGDFNVPVPNVDFLDVTENSGTDTPPLYGAPDPFAVGLDFDPTSFTASSSGGGADITDGQLNFTIMGNPSPIASISLFEAGDYTLAGTGGAGTAVAAAAIVRATVLEINGVAVTPIALAPVNASFSDALPGLEVASPWSLGLFVDVAGQSPGATKVEVVVNNVLVAQSESQGAAFIAKKDFRVTVELVPEPATAGMALLALAGLATSRKRS